MKILYVTTISNTVNAFLIPHIQMLIEEGHQVDVAFNIVQEVDPQLVELGCKIHEIDFQRSPLDIKNITAFKKLKKVITLEMYDVVHTHTPTASAIVRLVCKNIKSIKVFYTAHGFHFYSGAPLMNWLIYYPIEKLLAADTNLIFTINREDFANAGKFYGNRAVFVNGVGINLKRIEEINVNRERKLEELDIPKEAFVILSVGELNKNKNHEAVLRALHKLSNKNIHYIICGQGSLDNYLKNIIEELGLIENVKLLGYRKDVIELYKSVDLFIFPSFREGLPVSVMEAMACGLPVICSDIRGNHDLIGNNQGGFLVKPDDVEAYAENIDKYYNSIELRAKCGNININNIKEYSIINVLDKMKEIYNRKLSIKRQGR